MNLVSQIISPLVSFFDLPAAEQADFDFIEESDRSSQAFFLYQDSRWYVGDFLKDSAPEGWDAAMGTSAFSAVVIKLTDDFEGVHVATAIN